VKWFEDISGGGVTNHTQLSSLTSGGTNGDAGHSQFALLAGRTGGQALKGGLATSSHLDLYANDQTLDFANTGRIRCFERMVFDVTGSSSADLIDSVIKLTGTITSTNDISALSGVGDERVITYNVAQFLSAAPTFSAGLTFQPTDTFSDTSTVFMGFSSSPRVILDTASKTVTTPTLVGLVANPRVKLVTGTALTVTNVTGVASGNGPGGIYSPLAIFDQNINRAAGTLTIGTYRGFHATDPGTNGTYTLTTNVGVDIESLTKGTTNIGLRNAGTTVWTPSSSQTISAAGNTILANATVVLVSNTTAGSITLTSTPHIADGVNGQVVTLVATGTQNIVLRDQSAIASNLRLPGAANLTLGTNDTATFVFSSTVGDWVCVGTSNN
jgi:hypothetical protein